MRVIVCKNYDELSLQGAKLVSSLMTLKPECILGLATGSTPIGLYKKLVDMHNEDALDFSKVTSYNLDEYFPISPDNNQSYRYFMNENLFNHVNINKEKTFVPNGMAKNPQEECIRYENMIENCGGVDLQILGIGQNGHIGFNEPDDNLITTTHITNLTQNTIEANSRFFSCIDDVPTKALTMGIATILKAKKIVILACGKGKKEAVATLLTDNITTQSPATMLKSHPDVVLICDEEAYN